MTVRRTKIECCNGCTERQADPNCHGFCKRYLEQKAELEENKAEERKRKDIERGITDEYFNRCYKVTKRTQYCSKYRKPR